MSSAERRGDPIWVTVDDVDDGVRKMPLLSVCATGIMVFETSGVLASTLTNIIAWLPCVTPFRSRASASDSRSFVQY